MSESNLYDLILSQYNHTDENSILDRAQLIKGKTLDYISQKSPFDSYVLDKSNKGEVGNFIEKEWFGLIVWHRKLKLYRHVAFLCQTLAWFVQNMREQQKLKLKKI